MGVSQVEAQNAEGQEDEPQVLTVSEVTMETGVMECHNQNGVVSGNICQGGVVRGGANLLVQGEVKGTPEHPCVIEIGGSLTVGQTVEHAKITAREMVIEGDVVGCRIQLDFGAEIHGGLTGTQISIGNRKSDIYDLRHLRIEQHRAQQQLDELKVRIGLVSRRFIRDYPEVDLQMGAILKPTDRELRVDLRSFYQALGQREDEDVGKALEQFYLRVMVGALTRANKHYISRNPSRHKVFLKLIEDLREHVLIVREADQLTEITQEKQKQKEKLLDKLLQPTDVRLSVGGRVGDGVNVQLLQLRRDEGLEAQALIELDEIWAEAKVTETDKTRLLELTHLNGKQRTAPIRGDGLLEGCFAIEDEKMVWQSDE